MNPDIQQLQNRITKLESQLNMMVRPDSYVFERPIKGGAKGLKIKGWIYYGIVNGATAPFQSLPSGWTVSGGGDYTVTHNLGTNQYIVVATAFVDGGAIWAYNDGQTTTTFGVSTSDKGGASVNAGFAFALILL